MPEWSVLSLDDLGSRICFHHVWVGGASFVIPFQSGWIASLDRTGRTVVLLPFLQGIGIAAGPVLAGLVIVE